MRSGVSQRILAGLATPRRAIRRRPPGFPRFASPKRRVPDGVALLAQPPAQVVDPSPRALAFRARGPRDLLDIDLGQALDRPAHFIGQRRATSSKLLVPDQLHS